MSDYMWILVSINDWLYVRCYHFIFSQAIVAGKTMYISGQIGIDPTAGGNLVEGGVEKEAEQV